MSAPLTGWLLSLKPVTSPTHVPGTPEVEARKRTLLGLWSWMIAPVTDHGDGDVEDFYEQAARLEAMLSEVDPGDVWIDAHDGSGLARLASTAMTVPLADVAHLPRYGSQDRSQEWALALAGERAADAYAGLESFRRNAGRRVVVCGHNTDSGPQLTDTVFDLAGAAGAWVLVKATRAKHGFWVLHVPEAATRDMVAEQLVDATEWELVRAEGQPGAFLVQDWVTMQYEYRLFIVDGVPVTGAGAIEEHTPLNNSAPFNTGVRRDRHEGTMVVERQDIVSRLVEFGRMVAVEVAAEKPELTGYVLDVALGRSGKPLVVEINSLLNSGLYASDPRLVVRALARVHGADQAAEATSRA